MLDLSPDTAQCLCCLRNFHLVGREAAELPSKQPLGSFLVAFSSTHLVGCMPIHEPEGWQQAPDMMHILTVVLEDQAFKFTERTTSFLCAEHKVPQHEFNFLHFQHV